MAYPSVPKSSKTQIDAAARLLSRGKMKHKTVSDAEIERSIELVNAWRVSHSYPLNTFNVNLRQKVRGYGGAVVAQRLKRMPTILDKLVREPTMQLTNMQDLGGVRAILRSTKQVYATVDKYRANSYHELINEKDYISAPRGKDGYRSYHLIYKYRGNAPTAQQYNGLRIEIQLRTRVQHSWATAVETMGVILGQQLKSRQGEKAWLEFFACVSNAFAHIEGTALVPGYETLTKQEAFQLVKEKEAALNAIEKFNAFSKAMEYVVRPDNQVGRPKNGFYLLRLDMSNHSIVIMPYKKEDATLASEALEGLESEAVNNKNLDALLVSVGPLDELRKAYPNYFLDVSEFVIQLRRIIELSNNGA